MRLGTVAAGRNALRISRPFGARRGRKHATACGAHQAQQQILWADRAGAWFDVRVVADTYYHLRGNNNNYRLSDVTLGMRLDGGIVDFASGKTIKG